MDITFTPDDPEIGEVEFTLDNETITSNAVSYTHLTLPTN